MEMIIDRFEGDFAVAELSDGSFADLPRKLLPADAKEGCVVDITVNWEKTKERTDEIRQLMDSVWED